MRSRIDVTGTSAAMSVRRPALPLLALAAAGAVAGCGSSHHSTASALPVPLTSSFLCRRLDLDRLHALTGDDWKTATPAHGSIACDVRVGPNVPGELHVLVDDERRKGESADVGELLVRMTYRHERSFGGHRVAGTQGRQWARPEDGTLLELDGRVLYSVQLVDGHRGQAAIVRDRQILDLLR